MFLLGRRFNYQSFQLIFSWLCMTLLIKSNFCLFAVHEYLMFASTNLPSWLVLGSSLCWKCKVWNCVLGDCFSDLFWVTVADHIIAYSINVRALVPYLQLLFLSWRCDVWESIKQLNLILNTLNLILQGGELEMQSTQNPSIFQIR